MLVSESVVRQKLIDWCEQTSQRFVAKQLGVSEQHVSDLVRGNRGISADIAEQLGYKRVIAFENTKDPEGS